MDFENDVGAEADTTPAAVEKTGIPPNYDAVDTEAGEVAPGPEVAEELGGDKPVLPPLSVEEYQKRHQQTTAALKETRQRERATRSEVEQLRATVQQIQTTQPQAFQRFMLDQQMAEYSRIDWDRWAQQDPEKAQIGYREFQTAQARKAELEQQDRQWQEQQQQEQQRQQLNALVSTLGEQESAYRQTKPDYDKAVEFLKAELTKDANAQGFFGPQAEQAVTNHLVTIGHRVNASGQDMAEFGYNEAMRRGYAPEAAKPSSMAPIIAGEAAARTISNVGAAGGQASGSFEETMSNLNGAAARKFWDKAKRSQFR